MVYRVRQRLYGLSEVQSLLVRHSGEIADFAFRSGKIILPGQPVSVDVSLALNMMIHSEAASHGVEAKVASDWLPRLRNEALLHLGHQVPNWEFNGDDRASMRFFENIWGGREKAEAFLAPLLNCYRNSARRQLRFHSAQNVDFLTASEVANGHSGPAPRFVIDAWELADRFMELGTPLFFASERETASY